MRVAKWGNSLAVRLPKALVEALGLKAGDELSVVAASKKEIVVEKRDRGRSFSKQWSNSTGPRRRATSSIATKRTSGEGLLRHQCPRLYDHSRRARKHRAETLGDGGVVSTQVLNEFVRVARKKLRLEWADRRGGPGRAPRAIR